MYACFQHICQERGHSMENRLDALRCFYTKPSMWSNQTQITQNCPHHVCTRLVYHFKHINTIRRGCTTSSKAKNLNHTISSTNHCQNISFHTQQHQIIQQVSTSKFQTKVITVDLGIRSCLQQTCLMHICLKLEEGRFTDGVQRGDDIIFLCGSD